MTTKKHAQETEQPDTKEGEEPADEPIRDFEGEFAAAKYERDVAVARLLQAASNVDHTSVVGVKRADLLDAARTFADKEQRVFEAYEAGVPFAE